MRPRYGFRVELAPAGAQMLVGTDEIDRAGRGVEALREQPLRIEQVFADDGELDAFRRLRPDGVGGAVDINQFERAGEVFDQMGVCPVRPRERRIGERGAELGGAGERRCVGCRERRSRKRSAATGVRN